MTLPTRRPHSEGLGDVASLPMLVVLLVIGGFLMLWDAVTSPWRKL